jgi:hypothetical protein
MQIYINYQADEPDREKLSGFRYALCLTIGLRLGGV